MLLFDRFEGNPQNDLAQATTHDTQESTEKPVEARPNVYSQGEGIPNDKGLDPVLTFQEGWCTDYSTPSASLLTILTRYSRWYGTSLGCV